MQRIKRWIVVVGVALVIVGAVAVHPVPPVAAQDDTVWTCAQINQGVLLNVRSGPGVAYDVLVTQQPGEQLDADMTRREFANGYTWVAVRLPSGDQGWTILRRLEACPNVSPTAPVPADMPAASPSLTNVNADGTLDHVEIAALARSVVLLAEVRGSRILPSGTGTITTPDGMIVTNSHVVEGIDTVAVGLLDDINDPPEYRYLGEVVRRDDRIDVALIALRADMNGRPVNAAGLSLPYIPAELAPNEVYRGDSVYIFGYPGIGNDFLVVTTGSIVSVENGNVKGQRLPVWYRTDAEIAPGNSGGLVVNGNGQFVGIPTFVESEGLTGGRLGGIRPVQVALMAVLDSTRLRTATQDAVSESAIERAPDVAMETVEVRQGAIVSGAAGIEFRVTFVISGWQGRAAQLVVRMHHDDAGSSPLVNPDAPAAYRDASGLVGAVELLEPCCDRTAYTGADALKMFLPYDALGLDDAGAHRLQAQIVVEAGDGSWTHTVSWESVTVEVE